MIIFSSSLLDCLKEGLKLKTSGYQWAKSSKIGVDKILTINSISESPKFQLGKIDKLWVVILSSNELAGNLKTLAKERIS